MVTMETALPDYGPLNVDHLLKRNDDVMNALEAFPTNMKVKVSLDCVYVCNVPPPPPCSSSSSSNSPVSGARF